MGVEGGREAESESNINKYYCSTSSSPNPNPNLEMVFFAHRNMPTNRKLLLIKIIKMTNC